MFNSISSGMPFPGDFMEEFSMKGKWTNRRTGQVVTVRDVMIMDDGMSVMLSDGSMIDMNDFSRDYIQMSDEIYDMNGNVVGKEPVDERLHRFPPHTPEFKPSQKPHIPPTSFPEHNHKPGFRPTPSMKPGPQKPGKPMPGKPHPGNPEFPGIKEDHLKMIDQLFKTKKPTVAVDLKMLTKNFPIDEIKMLIDVFGVSYDEIAVYLFKKYFTIDLVIEAIKQYIRESIDKKDEPEVDVPDNSKPDCPEKPSKPCKPCKPSKKHPHRHGDDPTNDANPWVGHKKHHHCDCEREDDKKDDEENVPEINIPEVLDPGFTVEPENPGTTPSLPDIKVPDVLDEQFTVPTMFSPWDNYDVTGSYNEYGTFEFVNGAGNECLIYTEEDGTIAYFELIDNEWYQVFVENDNSLRKVKLPIAGEQSPTPEETPKMVGPDGIEYEGKYNEAGAFLYVDSQGRDALIYDETGNGDYVYFFWDEDGHVWQVFVNPDGTLTETELPGQCPATPEEDEFTAVLPTGESIFGNWEEFDGGKKFEGFLENGDEILIAEDETGERTYMVLESDGIWYFYIYDENGNFVEKQKMPGN